MVLYLALCLYALLLVFIGLEKKPCNSKGRFSSYESPLDKRNTNNSRLNRSLTNALISIFILILWMLTAFRAAEIGNDTRVYLQYFDIFGQTGIDETRSFEIGYQALNVLIARFTHNPHYFLVIIATITYAGTFWFLVNDSSNLAASACLFFASFFSFYMSGLRQSIAITISLFGYMLLKRNKRIASALLFLLAMQFHTSAIVCFLLFFHPKWYKNILFVCAVTFLCFIISYTGVLSDVTKTLIPRYSHYYSSRYAATGRLAVTYSLVKSLALYFIVSHATSGDSVNALTLSCFVLLAVFSSFGFSVNLFTRASNYFEAIALTEFPNALYERKSSHRKLLIFIVCFAELVVFLSILVYRPGWNHICPYVFWS